MIYALIALVVLLVASLVGNIVLMSAWRSAQLNQLGAQQDATLKRHQNESLETALKLGEALRNDERTRYSGLVSALKQEIAYLETTASRDPADVRARLQRLFEEGGDIETAEPDVPGRS